MLTRDKVCIKSPCTVSTALLALREVHGLLIQTLDQRQRALPRHLFFFSMGLLMICAASYAKWPHGETAR